MDYELWASFFTEKLQNAGDPIKWLRKKWTSHRPVYDLIEKLKPFGNMLEVGCGLAATSIAMNLRGFTNTALDINSQVLELTAKVASEAHAKIKLIQGDMFDLRNFYGRYDIVYSGGVLEHLDEYKAVKLLLQQKKVATYIVVVIPTKSEKHKAPIPRFPYGVKELIDFGKRAGLQINSILLFKGVKPEYQDFNNHTHLNSKIDKLEVIKAQRICAVFRKSQ